MVEPVRRKPVRSDAVANRTRLLEAAEEYLGREGIDAPLRGVAQTAGVGQATLYRHFSSHAQLIRELYDRIIERVEDAFVRAQLKATSWEVLESFVRDMVNMLLDHPASLEVMRRQAVNDPTHHPGRRMEEPMERMVAGAIADGDLRPDVHASDLATIPHLFHVLARYPEPLRSIAVERQLQLLFDGMRADGRPSHPLPVEGMQMQEFHVVLHDLELETDQGAAGDTEHP